MAELAKPPNLLDKMVWLEESVKRLQAKEARAAASGGPPGPTGATGPAGPAGPAGPTGATGGHEGAGRITGEANISGNFTAASCPFTLLSDAAGTIPYQMALTPSVNSWWPVEAMALVRVLDAQWYRLNVDLVLFPADVDGINRFTVSVMHYGGLPADWEAGMVRAQWKLAASTSYTCAFQAGNTSGGTWQYYRGGQHMWMASEGAFPR